MPERTAFLKPACSTVTWYLPTINGGDVKNPSPLLSAATMLFVSTFSIETLAPLMAAPLESVTVPRMVPLPCCAQLDVAHSSRMTMDETQIFDTESSPRGLDLAVEFITHP